MVSEIVVVEILFGTSVVNSLVLYKMANKGTKPSLKITKLRELLALQLIQAIDPQPRGPLSQPQQQDTAHRLVAVEGPKQSTRCRCSGCYK